MFRIAFLMLILGVAACTSAPDVQSECAAKTESFAAEISCIENMVAADPYMNGDSYVQEYILGAKVLAEKLEAGKISENEARYKLSKLYNRMTTQQLRREVHEQRMWDDLRPRQMDCSVNGNHVSCRGY